MEEQVPELLDLSDNEISSIRENQQGTTTETEDDNEKKMEIPDISIQ